MGLAEITTVWMRRGFWVEANLQRAHRRQGNCQGLTSEFRLMWIDCQNSHNFPRISITNEDTEMILLILSDYSTDKCHISKLNLHLGMVAYVCYPSTRETEARWIGGHSQPGQQRDLSKKTIITIINPRIIRITQKEIQAPVTGQAVWHLQEKCQSKQGLGWCTTLISARGRQRQAEIPTSSRPF